MCIIRTFPPHGVARFIISSHILMSQFFKIGPISLSNLVNLAFLFAPQGFQPLEITLTLLPFDGSIEWRGLYRAGWGDGGGGGGWSRRGSYRPFDIIMVHYSSEGSQRATASYTRGQTEYHLALIEASVLWAAALSLPEALWFNCRYSGYTGLPRVIRNAQRRGYNHVSPSLFSPLDSTKCRGIDLQASFACNKQRYYQSFNEDFKSASGSAVTSASIGVVHCLMHLLPDPCSTVSHYVVTSVQASITSILHN